MRSLWNSLKVYSENLSVQLFPWPCGGNNVTYWMSHQKNIRTTGTEAVSHSCITDSNTKCTFTVGMWYLPLKVAISIVAITSTKSPSLIVTALACRTAPLDKQRPILTLFVTCHQFWIFMVQRPGSLPRASTEEGTSMPLISRTWIALVYVPDMKEKPHTLVNTHCWNGMTSANDSVLSSCMPNEWDMNFLMSSNVVTCSWNNSWNRSPESSKDCIALHTWISVLAHSEMGSNMHHFDIPIPIAKCRNGQTGYEALKANGNLVLICIDRGLAIWERMIQEMELLCKVSHILICRYICPLGDIIEMWWHFFPFVHWLHVWDVLSEPCALSGPCVTQGMMFIWHWRQ